MEYFGNLQRTFRQNRKTTVYDLQRIQQFRSYAHFHKFIQFLSHNDS
jgi:hypothetical protein